MTDEELANDLNIKRRSGDVFVNFVSLVRKLVEKGKDGIKISTNLAQAMNQEAITNPLIREVLMGLRAGIDVNIGDPVVGGVLDSLAAGVNDFTATDAADVKSIAENLVSDAEFYGFGTVTKDNVTHANIVASKM